MIVWRQRLLAAALLAITAAGVACGEAWAQVGVPDTLAARVWLDRGEDPLLQAGDRVRIYYQVSQDAYVAIFQISTDGLPRLMYPASPEEDGFTPGERDYRLLLPQSPYWFVDDAPGLGYFFIVASPEPLDFGRFQFSFHEGGWDLSAVTTSVYQDPYLAMDDFVMALIPDWEFVPYALDFTSYDVGEVHSFPRFLCYDCHGYRPYEVWNPYAYSCATFRLVIWDDPYYYPAYRYAGTRVVWTRPVQPGAYPRFTFKERAADEPYTPQVARRDVSAGGGPLTRTMGGEGTPTWAGSGSAGRSAASEFSGLPAPAARRGDPPGTTTTPGGGTIPRVVGSPRILRGPPSAGEGAAAPGSTAGQEAGVRTAMPPSRRGGATAPPPEVRPTDAPPASRGAETLGSPSGRGMTPQGDAGRGVPGTPPVRPSDRLGLPGGAGASTGGANTRPGEEGGVRVFRGPTGGSLAPGRAPGSSTSGPPGRVVAPSRSARPVVAPSKSRGAPSRPTVKSAPARAKSAPPRRPPSGGKPPPPPRKKSGGG